MKRTVVGAFLFLVLVGELTVGWSSGLFSPGGLIVFGALYVTYFLLIDSLVAKYHLSNLQLVLINFALYSVLITGLLHGEIRDYVLHPQRDLITSLIRLQSAIYPIFAYPLLRRLVKERGPVLPLTRSIILFVCFVMVISLIAKFGLKDLINTVHVAPRQSFLFIVLGAVALIFAASMNNTKRQSYRSRAFYGWSTMLFILGCIPLVASFVALIFTMLGVGVYFLRKPEMRHALVE